MLVFLNGEFVPEERACVSVFDRAFLYGDGLFETLRVCQGCLFRWEQHWERLARGAAELGIRLPFPSEKVLCFAGHLVRENNMPEALLRLTLSRGVGPRGYSPRGADSPVLVMTLHPAPPLDPLQPAGWRLAVSSLALPSKDPLAGVKTCNKLRQILARAEAGSSGADEALLLNSEGHVVEGASSNLFWVQRETVHTPSLSAGILPGVTRAVVFDLCRALGFPLQEAATRPQELRCADGVFLSVSSLGIAEALSLDGNLLRRSDRVTQLHRSYTELLLRETAVRRAGGATRRVREKR